MRKRATVEPRYFETYHYANVITTVVFDPFEHGDVWDEFLGDGELAGLIRPYAPDSAFHQFIMFMVDRLLYDYSVEVDLEQAKTLAPESGGAPRLVHEFEDHILPLERALKSRRFEFEPFSDWLRSNGKQLATADADDIHDYFLETRLCGPYDDLLAQTAREVFFTLFTNRTLLLQFNSIVARHVSRTSPDELSEDSHLQMAPHFERPGVLRRAPMPEWVRRAVFFRDRGSCVGCNIDLSGILSLGARKNFDHMVPLVSGGLNDVTNIQLLCERCNQRKGEGEAFTSGTYEDWYSMAPPPKRQRGTRRTQ